MFVLLLCGVVSHVPWGMPCVCRASDVKETKDPEKETLPVRTYIAFFVQGPNPFHSSPFPVRRGAGGGGGGGGWVLILCCGSLELGLFGDDLESPKVAGQQPPLALASEMPCPPPPPPRVTVPTTHTTHMPLLPPPRLCLAVVASKQSVAGHWRRPRKPRPPLFPHCSRVVEASFTWASTKDAECGERGLPAELRDVVCPGLAP